MFSRFFAWLKEVAQKMFGHGTFNEQAGIPVNVVSDAMVTAIDDWCDLYENKAPWLQTNAKTLSLPSRIASEIATMVTLEMEMKVVKAEGGELMALFLEEQLKSLLDDLRQQTEYACAKGGLVFKPYIDGNMICYDYVQADDFYPCAFNSKNEITSAAFLSRKKDGADFFTRVEKHTLVGTTYTITNAAFRSHSVDQLGDAIELASIDEWADIDPVTVIQPVSVPLFAYFKIPLGNTVDPKSPLGVSVYSRVYQAKMLEEADRQYQRLQWEYEGGELAVDASLDAFRLNKGVPELPAGKERLYRMNTVSGESGNKLMETFSPALRDESYSRGLDGLLKQIEDNCGLSRGTLSDPSTDARTATEIKMAKQRTYATVFSIQKALENALRTLVEATAVLAVLYHLAPAGKYELTFVWDDSVLTDADLEKQHDLEEVAAGIMLQWEYRVKWYGEDEATAKAKVAEKQTNENIMFPLEEEPEAPKV